MRRQITLLQRFSVVTLLTTAAMAVILALQVTSSIERTALEGARNELAEVIRSRRPFWLDAPDPGAEFARLHDAPADYQAWRLNTDSMLLGYAIYRIKVWNREGTIIWSDAPDLIGQAPENPEVKEALEGQVESEITDLSKAENAADGIEGKAMELYVPILARNSFEVIGVIEVYQEITDLYETIWEEQRQAWVLIGSMMLILYLALFTMMANASRRLSRLQRVAELERYFSPAVAQAIASMGSRVLGKGNDTRLTGRTRATVMFTDIRGFTRYTEQMAPENVVAMLSDYVDLVTGAVFEHGGSVDKFLGDGVLAVFGAPLAQADHAYKALKAAEEVRLKMADLNEKRAALGEPPIQVGVALATGEVVTGTLGRGAQLAYTVVGDTVNQASRLVGVARPGELLVTAATYEEGGAAGAMSVRFDGPLTIRIRGRNEPVTIYASADPNTHVETPDETGFTVRHLHARARSLAAR